MPFYGASLHHMLTHFMVICKGSTPAFVAIHRKGTRETMSCYNNWPAYGERKAQSFFFMEQAHHCALLCGLNSGHCVSLRSCLAWNKVVSSNTTLTFFLTKVIDAQPREILQMYRCSCTPSDLAVSVSTKKWILMETNVSPEHLGCPIVRAAASTACYCAQSAGRRASWAHF